MCDTLVVIEQEELQGEGDEGDSSFTAKTLSDLRAAHTAQRLPSICKPGGLQVANFFVPVR